ncbi:MAG TPA: ABC transporter permease [Candidatus Lachnoclostridium stercorigallinarum]|uniref:ABC transporter permease n=1 Tax=Candidatus Lachnoclostridium stercorigallinarum TaxID=2838634 RepID=A0A9D2GJS1_9FIRM|nr:ABC transporter permease [Candidatus Lachnoclostridium stercorigallinarum]
MSRERSFNIIRTAVAMLVAILVAFVIIVLVSDQPVESIKIFLLRPFSTKRYLGNIVETAVPLIFSGLAMAIMFRANLFNLGGEGIFFIAGITGSIAAIWPQLPPIVFPIVCIMAGALTGILVMLIPGVLKAKYGASEMVTSLMMNNILLGVGLYLLNNMMRDPQVASLVSYQYRSNALLGNIIPGTRVHVGFLIALACAFAAYVFLFKSKWGYEIRMVGNNGRFASYSGINVTKVIIIVHVVAGAIAGMGGIIECLGMHRRFEWTALPGYGFDGAMIAMLAGNHPIGVIGAAFFVSYLRVGADLVNRASDVPTEMIAILQSIIILLISAERFLHKYKQNWIEKEAK